MAERRIIYSKRTEPEQRNAKGDRMVVYDGEPDSPRILIQGRAGGPDRRRNVGTVRKGGQNQPVRHPRRSDVAILFNERTADLKATAFKQDGSMGEEGDICFLPRTAVVFEGDLTTEINKARKRRTTRKHWEVPLGKGAVLGFRMPSKLDSRHLPPKLRSRTDHQRQQ